MLMREYYDAKHGPGSWDRMHDKIDDMDIFGWVQPELIVDGHTVSVFPGTNREVTVEQITAELRKVLHSHDH